MYNQFDDIMLLSEGILVFHGPREEVRALSCDGSSIAVSCMHTPQFFQVTHCQLPIWIPLCAAGSAILRVAGIQAARPQGNFSHKEMGLITTRTLTSHIDFTYNFVCWSSEGLRRLGPHPLEWCAL